MIMAKTVRHPRSAKIFRTADRVAADASDDRTCCAWAASSASSGYLSDRDFRDDASSIAKMMRQGSIEPVVVEITTLQIELQVLAVVMGGSGTDTTVISALQPSHLARNIDSYPVIKCVLSSANESSKASKLKHSTSGRYFGAWGCLVEPDAFGHDIKRSFLYLSIELADVKAYNA